MYEKFKMKNMTWQEFAKKKDNVIILPVGATEQHGPHLPTCVDAVLAEEFACRIAEKIDGVVAPTLSYGYKSKPLSGGGPLFPGTIDLNGATLQALVMDIIDEFVRDGFTKIFILSAHFENEAFIVEAMDLCSAKYGDKVKLLLTNWWDPMSPEVFDEVPFPGWALEHAAVTETSLMMYFAPELVREDKILDTENASPATYFRYPIEKDIVPETGVLASAKSSSAERGKIIVDDVVPNIIKIVEEAFK